MKRKGWFAAIVASGVAIAFIVGLEMTSSPSPPVLHLNFLAGQKPIIDEVDEFGWLAQGPYAGYEIGGHSNRDGPASLRRMQDFKFKGDYDEVAGAARTEMAALCGTEDREIEASIADVKRNLKAQGKDTRALDMVEFSKGEEWMVSIRRSPHGPNNTEDPTLPFVNVMVSTNCDVGFVGSAKRLFRLIGIPMR